jgi:hypothetical protein
VIGGEIGFWAAEVDLGGDPSGCGVSKNVFCLPGAHQPSAVGAATHRDHIEIHQGVAMG